MKYQQMNSVKLSHLHSQVDGFVHTQHCTDLSLVGTKADDKPLEYHNGAAIKEVSEDHYAKWKAGKEADFKIFTWFE